MLKRQIKTNAIESLSKTKKNEEICARKKICFESFEKMLKLLNAYIMGQYQTMCMCFFD